MLSLFPVQRSSEIILLTDELHHCLTMPQNSDHGSVALQHEGTAVLSLSLLLCCMPILLAVTKTYILVGDPSAQCVYHLPVIARLPISSCTKNHFLR